jgi:hypothetical protein
MNQQGKNSGCGNRGKTNYVFPPFPQPLLLPTYQDIKQRPKTTEDRLHKIPCGSPLNLVIRRYRSENNPRRMDDQLKLRHDPVATARGSDTHSRLIEVAPLSRSLPVAVLYHQSPVSRALIVIDGRLSSDESLAYFRSSAARTIECQNPER